MSARKRARPEGDAGTCELVASGEMRVGSLDAYAALWDDRELCDVVLLAGDERFPCHRLVLAAGSAYMRARFRSEWSARDEGTTPTVRLDGSVTAAALRAILEFLYRGTAHVTQGSLAETMAAASLLEVGPLLSMAATFLYGKLSPESCIPTITVVEALDRCAPPLRAEHPLRAPNLFPPTRGCSPARAVWQARTRPPSLGVRGLRPHTPRPARRGARLRRASRPVALAPPRIR